MQGSYVPLPKTGADKTRTNDPRTALDDRYHDKDQYVGLVTKAALDLVGQGFLLTDDVAAIVKNAALHWDHALAPAGTSSARP
jgi:hypothetical protein